MYGKLVLSFIFMFLLLISYSIFIGTFDIQSYFNPLLKSPTGAPVSCQPDPPLGVYMYDLSPRFNVRMINHRNTTETLVTAVDWPPWPGNWGLKRQHSVEYWMMGSLIHEGERREAVRVSDPEVADVFFVPFFFSLSFNRHGHNMTDPDTEIDRKLEEGIVRAKLSKILTGYDDVHYEQSFATEENIKMSSMGMRSSKFCLHPAGDTPSSCRLFDAIVSHCVPVIVGDQIELPFEDEIDYSQFSLFFSFKEALKPDYMINQLRDFPKEKWSEMWRQLKNISHHYEFQYPPKREDAVNMLWRQVKHKLPEVKLSVHRSRRLKIPDW